MAPLWEIILEAGVIYNSFWSEKMLNPHKLSELRFGMSEVPKIGGQPGTYEERWSQWFLERSFFRDFVYRNPHGRIKGQELADAVVLFDDVVRQMGATGNLRGKMEPLVSPGPWFPPI